jgi:hypothetical protein
MTKAYERIVAGRRKKTIRKEGFRGTKNEGVTDQSRLRTGSYW